jgi:DNA-binding Lrp family transcriptional regulator
MAMVLKPQDIVVALKLVVLRERKWTYAQLAYELGMSQAEVHAGIKRLLAAGIVMKDSLVPVRPVNQALEEFLIHGIKYVFPPVRGGITRGVVTSSSAPPLAKKFIQSEDFPSVWPDPEGSVRGQEFSPLYRSVPKAVQLDQQLYELLVLVDAIRGGRAREREIAIKELKIRLERSASTH